MPRLLQALLAALPLLLTPLFVLALAEGVIGVGGGEKDVLLAVPWLIGSTVFAISAWVLIARRWPPRRWASRSALVSLGLLAALWVVAFVLSSLGIG